MRRPVRHGNLLQLAADRVPRIDLVLAQPSALTLLRHALAQVFGR